MVDRQSVSAVENTYSDRTKWVAAMNMNEIYCIANSSLANKAMHQYQSYLSG
ncbi:hypothetical protein H6G04_16765 [Calothrix membranacea FACHB-236]|nr:hypothetical protein [Calothrix membranacea FACHB-236]